MAGSAARADARRVINPQPDADHRIPDELAPLNKIPVAYASERCRFSLLAHMQSARSRCGLGAIIHRNNLKRVIVLRPRSPPIAQLRSLATKLFTDGQYADADILLAELANMTEGDRAQIALRRAQIGMLSDSMADVEEQLEIACSEYGSHVYFVGLQADMAMRKGDLPSAAAALRQLGRHSRAAHLESFDGTWYQVGRVSARPVAWNDEHALPLFEVTINGRAGQFVLDTGTGDCLLDSKFARLAGVQAGPFDRAAFAGGRVGRWQLAVIDGLSIGGSRFGRLPAMIAPLADKFRHGFSDISVDGIVGAGLLRAAGGIDLDYHEGCLRLGPPEGEGGEALWIAGPHYPLTPCRANGGPSSCWFIDSGMSGVDIACSESAARRHGVQVLKGDIEAHGGGGSLAAKAMRIRHFRHGALEYRQLPAAVLPKFTLGRELGIRIGGIIGHDWLSKHRVQLDYRAMRTRITA